MLTRSLFQHHLSAPLIALRPPSVYGSGQDAQRESPGRAEADRREAAVEAPRENVAQDSALQQIGGLFYVSGWGVQ
ncbi:MAG: hypothetical protein D6770_10825 [Anaerolineae bacterium]|nr:MAG: hypothetical protein D6770_10825 [Anaerolineae bacterium]